MTAEGVAVAKDAKVVIDGKEGKLSDLKTGMQVTLQMSAEPDQSVIISIVKDKAIRSRQIPDSLACTSGYDPIRPSTP